MSKVTAFDHPVWQRLLQAKQQGQKVLFTAPPSSKKTRLAELANDFFAEFHSRHVNIPRLIDLDDVVDVGRAFGRTDRHRTAFESDCTTLLSLLSSLPDDDDVFFIGVFPDIEFYETLVATGKWVLAVIQTDTHEYERNCAVKFTPDDRAFHPELKPDYLKMVLENHKKLQSLVLSGTAVGFCNVCEALFQLVFDLPSLPKNPSRSPYTKIPQWEMVLGVHSDAGKQWRKTHSWPERS